MPQAQPGDSTNVLTAFLVEVRGLRAALEGIATAGPRVQLVLGRLQLQEQRILSQVRRHDAAAENLAAARRRLEPLTQRVRILSDGVNARDIDLETRRGRESELADVKAEWRRLNAEVQRFIVEEAQIAQDLGAEQTRWNDFNQKLEELERALARR
jgi:hypothetical protein